VKPVRILILGSNRKPATLNRLPIEKSIWLRRGVCSIPGGTIGTVNVLRAPGAINPPTTQPCDAELPGHTADRVLDVTVRLDPSPLMFVKFGAPAPPAVSACVPSR